PTRRSSDLLQEKGELNMKPIEELETLEDIEAFIQHKSLAFVYFSRPDCSVCTGLWPQIVSLLEKYPDVELAHIEMNHHTEKIAGYFSIFTVPVLMFYIEGKEFIREVRIIHLDQLENRLDTLIDNYQN